MIGYYLSYSIWDDWLWHDILQADAYKRRWEFIRKKYSKIKNFVLKPTINVKNKRNINRKYQRYTVFKILKTKSNRRTKHVFR